MAMSVKKKEPDGKGREVNIGVDVHKRSWRVTALLEGVFVMARSVPPTYEAFKKLLRRFEGARIRVAYEAGPAGFDLYDRLADDGMECMQVSQAPLLIDPSRPVVFRLSTSADGRSRRYRGAERSRYVEDEPISRETLSSDPRRATGTWRPVLAPL